MGNPTSNRTEVSLTLTGSPQQFWRVVSESASPDLVGPKLQVTSHPPKFTTKASILLKGTAKDANGVTRVSVQVGKGPRKAAIGTRSWRIKAPLKKGQNAIAIFSTDSFDNQSRKIIKVTRK